MGTTSYWFSEPPQEILRLLGFDVSYSKAKEIESVVDGNIAGWYYISALNDEAIKWLLGPIMVESKSRGVYFTKIIAASLLAEFGRYIIQGKIDKAFTKDIFSELLSITTDYPKVDEVSFEEYEKYGYNQYYYLSVRKRPRHILDDMLSDDKYKVSSDIDVLFFIDETIAENLDQFEKLKTNPKLLNWFVGQVMKKAKSKFSAEKVKSLIELRVCCSVSLLPCQGRCAS
jgi:Asp-tRNA(Asn)/Glu-tRNA(Gln) amidotransferase B subunit